jgi:hypothetical protein
VYIVCASNEVLYVGSTMKLSSRIAAHRSFTNISSRPLYACIRGYGGWDNVHLQVLRMDVGLSKRDVRRLEQETLENLHPIFNRNRAYSALSGTPYHREYRAEHRERFRTYNREYQRVHRERIAAQRRARRARLSEQEEIREASLVLQTLRDSP